MGSLGFCYRTGQEPGYADRQRLELAICRNQTVRRDQPVHRGAHEARLVVFALELRRIAARAFPARDFALESELCFAQGGTQLSPYLILLP
jgi:hypothetical protein